MNYTQKLLKGVQHTLIHAGGYKTNKVCVEIDGKIHYMDEYHLRALQLYVAEMSDEEYTEFCKRVIIYSGRNKRYSDHTVSIHKNGRLAQSFEDGFYTTSNTLALELLKHL